MIRFALFELFVTNLQLFEHQQKNLLVSCFLDPMA